MTCRYDRFPLLLGTGKGRTGHFMKDSFMRSSLASAKFICVHAKLIFDVSELWSVCTIALDFVLQSLESIELLSCRASRQEGLCLEQRPDGTE